MKSICGWIWTGFMLALALHGSIVPKRGGTVYQG
jgi:hypothetical protein